MKSWIDARTLSRAPSTISGYNRLYRLYIVDTRVGGMVLEDLDGSDMIELLSPLIRRGCTRQAQLLQVLVSAALRQAVRKRLLTWSPMDEVEKVGHVSKLSAWLTVDQARQLLATSAAAGDPYYVAWLLMLCCGLRRGEILGLRWSDIDRRRQLLHVERQKIEIDGDVLITHPKSACSVRDIPLNETILNRIPLHRGKDADILKGVSRSMLANALDRAIIRADVPRVTLHGLRHTMAATAAEDSISVKVLQTLLGHAHFQTTADIYAHVSETPRIQAISAISHSLLDARLEIV
ncbi:MAG: site-specific integrase [Lachnospiraceae bacterium]|nr:site-specific integrase [Lachnospiraceae bacterium]